MFSFFIITLMVTRLQHHLTIKLRRNKVRWKFYWNLSWKDQLRKKERELRNGTLENTKKSCCEAGTGDLFGLSKSLGGTYWRCHFSSLCGWGYGLPSDLEIVIWWHWKERFVLCFPWKDKWNWRFVFWPKIFHLDWFTLIEKTSEFSKLLPKKLSERQLSLHHVTFPLPNGRSVRNKAFQFHSATLSSGSDLLSKTILRLHYVDWKLFLMNASP